MDFSVVSVTFVSAVPAPPSRVSLPFTLAHRITYCITYCFAEGIPLSFAVSLDG